VSLQLSHFSNSRFFVLVAVESQPLRNHGGRHHNRSPVSRNDIGNIDKWEEKSQKGELDFWMSHWDAMVAYDGKQHFYDRYKQYFYDNGGFDVNKDFSGKTVIDIGAGPRPLTAVFKGVSKLIIVEPLGDKFLAAAKEKIPANSQNYLEIQRADKVYSLPAEKFITELTGTADVVVSTNSLDHTWDPITYLSNAKNYLKDDKNSFVLLVVDLHHRTEEMHPEQSLFPTLINQVYLAGLRYEKGECNKPAAHPALAFNSCWMVLTKNRDYDHNAITGGSAGNNNKAE
jgi:hypothetical protein